MEDCELRAANAIYLELHPTGCFAGSGQCAHGGVGGFALRADTQTSALVRCRFIDGNGSSIQTGNWNVPTVLGQAGKSQFVGSGGTLLAYDVLHQEGLAGTMTALPPDGHRGPVRQIGEALAPLTLGGAAAVGSSIEARVELFPHETAYVVLGVGWTLTPTPIGPVVIDGNAPFVPYTVFPPASLLWNVPNDPTLVDLPVTTQLIFTNRGWRVGNPSTVWLYR